MEKGNISIRKCSYEEIVPLRKLYLETYNCQIRYDSCHWRGWADHYLWLWQDQIVGYAAVKGLDELQDRDTLFEMFLIPSFVDKADTFLEVQNCLPGIKYMEAQTNDLFTTSLVYQACSEVSSKVILFEDDVKTQFPRRGTTFRKRTPEDIVFGKQEDTDEYVLELDGQVIAAGGFLLHYNKPFADLYMEVDPAFRRRGYATLILQEIKKACYLAERRPAARCNLSNPGSKASLLKAGFKIAGCMISGKIR